MTFTPKTISRLLSVPTALMLSTAIHAENTSRSLQIPAGQLSTALNRLAEASDLQMVYDTDMAQGLKSQALSGNYTPTQALQKLLQGSGLGYQLADNGTVTISRQAPSASPQNSNSPPGAAVLPTVKVTSQVEYEPNDLAYKDYQITDSSTATKTKTPLLETPLTVQVVPKNVIKDKGMQNPNDLAEVVAGVQPVVGYGNAPSQWFLIRGFSNDSLNYRNGFRLVEKYTPRDLANVERVEFVKGPASVLYGTNQPGGAVNTITKKPLDFDFLSTNLTGGSFDRFRGTIDANKKVGNLGMRLNVAGDTGNSYFDFENSQNWFIAPVLTYQFTPSTKIMYEGEFQETQRRGWSNGLPNFAASFSLPVNRTMSEPFTRLDNFNHTHHVEFEHSFNDDWRFRQGLYYSRTNRSFLSLNSDFSRLPTETVDAVSRYAYQSPDEHQENTVAQSELHGHFLTGAVDHQVVAGFETSHSLFAYVADFSFYDTINLVNPVYGGAVPAEAVGFGSQDMADTNAVYLQDQVKWGKWRLLAGWRHDEVETISKDPLSTFRSQQSEGADTARAGLLYTITPSTSVYYSFSQSFVPNLGRDINNGVFKADRGTQHEVGVKQSLLKGLDLTVSLFDIRRNNVVGPDADNPGFRVSNGEQSSQGIETSLTGDVTSDLHVITNLTWLDAKVESGDPERVGDRLYGVPDFSANAWGLYDLPLAIPGKLSTGFGIVHVGDREATLPNYGLKLPEYTRYDLGMFYKLKNMRVALNLRNLTDEKYYETLENFAVQAQPPLNWALSVGYDFQ